MTASAGPAAAAGLTVTASVAFGNVDFGVTDATSVAKSVRITNPLGGQPITGLIVQISGADAGQFAISSNGRSSTLAKGTNCTVMLTGNTLQFLQIWRMSDPERSEPEDQFDAFKGDRKMGGGVCNSHARMA